ncbi:MAG: prolipoprotein diacylglyceryl transferase [Clostridiaceae bacterium]
MNPVAFNVFGIDVMWYGILIACGVIAAMLLSSYICRIKGMDFDQLLDIFLFAFPAAIVGARLYYVVFEFDYYKYNLIDIFNIRQGGLAFHGGLIFALLTVFIYTRIKKLQFLKIMDTVAPGIVLAQAIGRWGNFFNSEAHGGPVSLEFIKHFPEFIQNGMHIGGVYYHPTFLYESAWNLIVCGILVLIIRKNPRNGTVIAAYLGLYSIGRFFIEGLRTDSLMLGDIRIAQLISVIAVITCIVALFGIYAAKQKN